MENRKIRLGLVITDVQLEYQRPLIQGVVAQCLAFGWDCFVLSDINNISRTAQQYSESIIYSLSSDIHLDAILYKSADFNSPAIVTERLKSLDIPVFTIDCICDDFPRILAPDEELWFDRTVTHLIEKHGYKKIMCLTGAEDKLQSQRRLEGYKVAMKRHNLDIPKDYIVFGDFWIRSAARLADRIASGELEMPEAIACANDTMAIALIEALNKNGYRVPDQIAVTGFDCSASAARNHPPITTGMTPSYNLGIAAVSRAYETIIGEKGMGLPLKSFELETGASCPCLHYQQFSDFLSPNLTRETLYHICNMTFRLASATNLREVVQLLFDFNYMLSTEDGEIVNAYLCLCKDWDYDEPNATSGKYTQTMSYQSWISEEDYNLCDALPTSIQNDPPAAYYFLPMFYKARRFGYLIYQSANTAFVPNDLHCLWCQNVSTALENLRTRNYISRLKLRVALTEQRDVLTGLLLLQGLEHEALRLFEHAMNHGTSLLCIYADIDSLRQINDSFGHIEGDNVITTAAHALSSACGGGEICARIKGDAFAICGTGIYTVEAIDGIIMNIRRYCDKYNAMGDKSYQLSLSIGYSLQTPTAQTTLYSIINQARQDMLNDKQQHRIRLKTPYFNKLSEIRGRVYSMPRCAWSVEELAKETQVSIAHFRRLYHEQFRCSFTSDVITSRISAAKRLLSETTMSIARIAVECGYQYEAYFMRQFKKATGLTPSEYRKAETDGPKEANGENDNSD